MKIRLEPAPACRSLLVAVMLLGPVALLTFANPGGAPPGFTNAPGEGNCTACHTTFALDSGLAGFAITAPPAPTPGISQIIGVGFSNSASFRHGFQITARDGNDLALGAWSSVGTGFTKNATGGQHHVQTTAGSLQTSWTMQWLPPATIANGPIKFYACGVEGFNNNPPFNDPVYSKVATMYQATLSAATTAWPIGTTQTINLSAPAHGGELYVIVPSDSPAPYSLGGPFVLEVDPTTGFLDLALQLPDVFQNIASTLDAAGQATASIVIPGYPPLIGLSLHFAAGTGDAMLNPTEVSNRITVTFQ